MGGVRRVYKKKKKKKKDKNAASGIWKPEFGAAPKNKDDNDLSTPFSNNRPVVHSRAGQNKNQKKQCDVLKTKYHHRYISEPQKYISDKCAAAATATAASTAVLLGLGLLTVTTLFFNPWSPYSLCVPGMSALQFLQLLSVPAVMANLFFSLEWYRFVKGAFVYDQLEKKEAEGGFGFTPGTSLSLKPHQKTIAFFSGVNQLFTAILPWGILAATACLHFQAMFGINTDWAMYVYAGVGTLLSAIMIMGLADKWPHSVYNWGVEGFKAGKDPKAKLEKQNEDTRPMVYSFNPAGIIMAALTQAIQAAFSYIPTEGNPLAEQFVLLLRVASALVSAILVPELSAMAYGLKNCGKRKPQTCEAGAPIVLHLAEKLKTPLSLLAFFAVLQVVSLHSWGHTDPADGWFNGINGSTCIPYTPVVVNGSTTLIPATTSTAMDNATTAAAATGMSLEDFATTAVQYVAVATVLCLGCYAQHRFAVGYRGRQDQVNKGRTKSYRSVSAISVGSNNETPNNEGNTKTTRVV